MKYPAGHIFPETYPFVEKTCPQLPQIWVLKYLARTRSFTQELGHFTRISRTYFFCFSFRHASSIHKVVQAPLQRLVASDSALPKALRTKLVTDLCRHCVCSSGHEHLSIAAQKYPRNTREMPEKCPRNAREIPEKCPRNAEKYPRNCQRNTREMPEKCPRNTREIREKYPRNTREIPEKYPRNTREMPEKCPRNARELPIHRTV